MMAHSYVEEITLPITIKVTRSNGVTLIALGVTLNSWKLPQVWSKLHKLHNDMYLPISGL